MAVAAATQQPSGDQGNTLNLLSRRSSSGVGGQQPGSGGVSARRSGSGSGALGFGAVSEQDLPLQVDALQEQVNTLERRLGSTEVQLAAAGRAAAAAGGSSGTGPASTAGALQQQRQSDSAAGAQPSSRRGTAVLDTGFGADVAELARQVEEIRADVASRADAAALAELAAQLAGKADCDALAELRVLLASKAGRQEVDSLRLEVALGKGSGAAGGAGGAGAVHEPCKWYGCLLSRWYCREPAGLLR